MFVIWKTLLFKKTPFHTEANLAFHFHFVINNIELNKYRKKLMKMTYSSKILGTKLD